MKLKTLALAIVLITVLLIVVVAGLNWSPSSQEAPEFYVGVEVAYTNTNVSDVREMVDRVKDYTNLFVIGSIELTYNETALNESCDYIQNAGLKIIVLFTNVSNYSYDTREWLSKAQQKYGDGFMGLYRYDEPGGDQLENPRSRFVQNATNYAQAAADFTEILRAHVDYYVDSIDRIFTADYGLYWWDYKTNYDAIFAEFVGNQSRQRHIAMCRGAAATHGKEWGTIITWKYDKEPYLENGEELYQDLLLAYTSGAKYIIIFNFPKIGPYGTMTDEHFDALKQFWDHTKANPQDFGSTKANVAYVLPPHYGFGLRRPDDSIWGIFPPDELSTKAWNDVSMLVDKYGAGFDVLFDDEDLGDVRNRYNQVFFWNQTIA